MLQAVADLKSQTSGAHNFYEKFGMTHTHHGYSIYLRK